MRAQEPVGERFVFAQQSEQQMLRLDIRASILARLISCKKDYAPSFLCIAFKHGSPKVFQGFASAPSAIRPRGCSGLGQAIPRPASAFRVPESERGRHAGLMKCCELPGLTLNGETDADGASSSKTFSALCSSRSPVGSSARSKDGPFTRARAIATRCCSPPDNCPPRCSARSANPTSPSQSFAVRSACAKEVPRTSSGIATFSAAVKSGSKWCRCQTKPTARLRYSASILFQRDRVANLRRSILHRLLGCPAPPAGAARCFSPLRTAPRWRSFRRG